MQTDEINNQGSTSSVTAENIGSYSNQWGEKLKTFGGDYEQFNKPFSREELGDGQAMSVGECARITAVHNSRERAGSAMNAQLDADLTWADVRLKEQKLVGKQLTRGIHQANNVLLTNELIYRVGRIPLHGEQRMLQLQQMQNNVARLREQVKVSVSHLAAEMGESESVDVDFSNIDVDEA